MKIVNLPFSSYIDSGSYAEVYKFENHAIKCPYHLRNKKEIEHEFEMQRRLFEAGIRVSQPFEIVRAKLSDRTVRGIEMELLEGKRASKFYGKAMELSGIYTEEIEKAKKLGFIPLDTDLANAVYSPEKGLYLIDFTMWRYLK